MSYAITIDEIDGSLERVSKLLAGVPDGVYRAVGSALKRAARHGLTVGMKIVSRGIRHFPRRAESPDEEHQHRHQGCRRRLLHHLRLPWKRNPAD